MNESINFADLANTKVSDVTPPAKLPEGHYGAMITGQMKEHKARSGNVAMRFPVRLIEPLSDVNAKEFEAAGGIPDKTFSLDFWMSVDARFIFTNFGLAMGHDEDLNLMELAEAIGTSGDPICVELTNDQDQNNPDRFYTSIRNAAPLDQYRG